MVRCDAGKKALSVLKSGLSILTLLGVLALAACSGGG